MIQVKEFINNQEYHDTIINKWLKEQGDKIKFVDIKYSVGAVQSEMMNGCSCNNEKIFSGALLIYETK